MAEDKRIRVSADASPLQELRQNAQALWNDFNKMESTFKDIAEQTVGVIQKQIDLLKERNALSGGMQGGSPNDTPTERRPSLIDPYTGRPLNPTYNRTSDFRGTNRAEQNQVFELQNGIFERILTEVTRIADGLEKEGRDDENQGDLGGIGGNGSGIGGNGSGIGGNGSGIGGNRRSSSQLTLPTSLMGALKMLPYGAALAAIIGAGDQAYGKMLGYEVRQATAENRFQRANIADWWSSYIPFYGTYQKAKEDESEAYRRSVERFNQSVNKYTSLHGVSYEQGVRDIVSTQTGRTGADIQWAGKWVVDEVERRLKQASAKEEPKTSSLSLKEFRELTPEERSKRFRQIVKDKEEQNTVSRQDAIQPQSPYVKDPLLAATDNLNRKRASYNSGQTGSEYELPTFSSEYLGMDMGEHAAKFAEFSRVGVRNTGGITEKTGAVNQLLFAQRMRGLSDSDAETVLRLGRYDRNNLPASNIVSTFDTNLQRLGKDNQYIASTLSEHIGSFERIANNILSRGGEINSKAILRSMTSIQNATGAEGRQLERLQNAFTGGSISQDDTTQALLLRTARELNPNGNLSDLQADIEMMQNNPKLQQQFAEKLETLTGGGEMFKQALHTVFGLSFTDIKKAVGKDGKLKKGFFESGISEGGGYNAEDVKRIIPEAERSEAASENKRIYQGVERTVPSEGKTMADLLSRLDRPLTITIDEASMNDLDAIFKKRLNITLKTR